MTQTLKAGDRGALVALLQLALERAGQMPGALDGIFGAQTAAAVRAFQAANALVPDGIAGAQTHRALLPYYTGRFAHRARGRHILRPRTAVRHERGGHSAGQPLP